MEDDALCAVVKLDLKVLLEDFVNNRMRHQADPRVLWFGDDWMFGLHQRPLGRKDDPSPRGINHKNLQGIRVIPSDDER